MESPFLAVLMRGQATGGGVACRCASGADQSHQSSGKHAAVPWGTSQQSQKGLPISVLEQSVQLEQMMEQMPWTSPAFW